MIKYINSIILLCCLTVVNHIYGQTADVTAGCAPLVVSFDSPNASSYFWQFGDGSQSVDKSPQHTFTETGDYLVELFDQSGGTKVGEINIRIYPPLKIDFKADVVDGCGPLTVNFTQEVNVHPDINIQGYVWSFGDGQTSSAANPSYIYSRPGIYDVSLRVVIDNNVTCEDTYVISDYIYVEGKRASFNNEPKKINCNIPAEFTFTNQTVQDPGETYLWTFGDGQTSTEYHAGKITYTTPGLYTVILQVTTDRGCISTFERTINVGSPVINLGFGDVICLNAFNQLTNNTIGDEFIWDFSDDPLADPQESTEKSPQVQFTTPGTKTMTLTAKSDSGCETTETITVTIDQPNSNFTIGPDVTCQDSFELTLTAEDLSHSNYIWENFLTNGALVTTESSIDQMYQHPERDSFYVNYPDSTIHTLVIESESGCFDTTRQLFVIQKPEAFFIPDVIGGCVPFEVVFDDLSTSPNNITNRDWDFGDGGTANLGPNDEQTAHTYTEGGIFLAELTVTDDENCVDISKQVEIFAIEKQLPPPFR